MLYMHKKWFHTKDKNIQIPTNDMWLYNVKADTLIENIYNIAFLTKSVVKLKFQVHFTLGSVWMSTESITFRWNPR